MWIFWGGGAKPLFGRVDGESVDFVGSEGGGVMGGGGGREEGEGKEEGWEMVRGWASRKV